MADKKSYLNRLTTETMDDVEVVAGCIEELAAKKSLTVDEQTLLDDLKEKRDALATASGKAPKTMKAAKVAAKKAVRKEAAKAAPKKANGKKLQQDIVRGISQLNDPKYQEKYGKAANCGDDVAECLKAAVDAGTKLEDVAEANGIEWRWAHLNKGMQRMNLGNVLRGIVGRGEQQVVIGSEKLGKVAKAQKAAKVSKKAGKAA